MARAQVLVQFDDDLLALLDERVSAAGASRSALIRQAVRAWLAEGAEARIDEAIAAGYRRTPASSPDPTVDALAAASIDEEPW